jgi:hypothetical protein
MAGVIFMQDGRYNWERHYPRKCAMKSKWKLNAPMDRYQVWLTARHARHASKRGNGDRNEGIRILIEEDAGTFVERRIGKADRRKKELLK